MGRSRSLRRSTPKVGKSSAEPLLAIPARSSWLFWSRSLLAKPQQRKFISSPIISRLIVPPRSGNSWSEIVMFASITPQPTPPGSTKLRSGFPKSSVMSSLAASSSRLKISIGNSSATSVATTKRQNPLSGLTPKLIGAFAPPRNQCNAALGAAKQEITRSQYVEQLVYFGLEDAKREALEAIAATGCSAGGSSDRRKSR